MNDHAKRDHSTIEWVHRIRGVPGDASLENLHSEVAISQTAFYRRLKGKSSIFDQKKGNFSDRKGIGKGIGRKFHNLNKVTIRDNL